MGACSSEERTARPQHIRAGPALPEVPQTCFPMEEVQGERVRRLPRPPHLSHLSPPFLLPLWSKTCSISPLTQERDSKLRRPRPRPCPCSIRDPGREPPHHKGSTDTEARVPGSPSSALQPSGRRGLNGLGTGGPVEPDEELPSVPEAQEREGSTAGPPRHRGLSTVTSKYQPVTCSVRSLRAQGRRDLSEEGQGPGQEGGWGRACECGVC